MTFDPHVAFSYEKTAMDLGQLEQALAETLRLSGHSLASGKDRRLLNLACGRADETGVLANQFAQGAQSLEILGADLRAPEIAEAQTRWGCDGVNNLTAQFEVNDGSRLLRALAPDKQFDIAFLRHQNFWNDPEQWRVMFRGALEQLNEDGLFVFTSYFDQEHELASEALRELGAVQLSDYRNPGTRLLEDAIGKSTDRRLAVFRKPLA
jgi:hypothetical protein